MSSAFLEVVNKSVNASFSNCVENDVVLYPTSSNQNIHIGCSSAGNSMIKVTRSNVEVSSNLNVPSLTIGTFGPFKLVTGTVASGSGSGSVSFGTTFASNPTVFAQIQVNITVAVYTVHVSAITTTGFNYSKSYTSGTSAAAGATGEAFSWLAIGPA